MTTQKLMCFFSLITLTVDVFLGFFFLGGRGGLFVVFVSFWHIDFLYYVYIQKSVW